MQLYFLHKEKRRNAAALQNVSDKCTFPMAATLWSAALLRRFGIQSHLCA